VYVKSRSHYVTNLGWIFRSFSLAVSPILLILILEGFTYIFYNWLNMDYLGDSMRDFINVIFTIGTNAWILLGMLFYSGIITYVWICVLNWYFNIFLVTNERLLHIEYKMFSGKHISEAPLKNIEDITEGIVGFLPSIFQYGDVKVQTAAEKNKFWLRSVPNPTWFRNSIADLSSLVHDSEP